MLALTTSSIGLKETSRHAAPLDKDEDPSLIDMDEASKADDYRLEDTLGEMNISHVFYVFL